MSFNFNICKVAHLDDDGLKADTNPFALIFLIAKAAFLKKNCKNKKDYDDKLLAYKLDILKLILTRDLPSDKEAIIIKFLYYYVYFEFKETLIKFEDQFNLLTNKTIHNMTTIEDLLLEDAKIEGYLLGEKKGKNLGEKKAQEKEIIRLITKLKFTDQQIADFTELPLKFIHRIRGNFKITA